MDALFPTLEEMQALAELLGLVVCYGVGFGAVLWTLGYLVAFVIEFFKEV